MAITHSGGVLVAPAEMGTIDDWEKKFNSMKNITPDPLTIDGEEEKEDDQPTD